MALVTTLPAIPAPPRTINAPVDVLVLAVVLLATKLPNVPVLPAGSLPATVNVPPTGFVNTIALAVVPIVAVPR